MCGRYTLKTDAATLAKAFAVLDVPELTARYNVAPSQTLPIVRRVGKDRGLDGAQWGLVPAWAPDAAGAANRINARQESAADKPSFRNPLRRQRCLVPADGYYEWCQLNGRAHPFYFTAVPSGVFAFAGLWDEWPEPQGAVKTTFAILTGEANEAIQPYHHRMPVIVPPGLYDLWLDPQIQDPDRLHVVYQAAAAWIPAVIRVSPAVNHARQDDASLILPATDEPPPPAPVQLSWL